jgi:hypothetical protein
MVRSILFIAVMLGATTAWSQGLKVEFDKDRDYTQYKSFRFGEGELVTPKDQRQVSEEQVDKWVKAAMTRELELKGLTRVDSTADLVISYVVGTLARSDAGDVGPLGLTPGSMDRTYLKDYRQGNIVIDLNDRRDIKVWRVNATMEMTSSTAEKMINQVIQKGFKKYPKSRESVKKK